MKTGMDSAGAAGTAGITKTRVACVPRLTWTKQNYKWMTAPQLLSTDNAESFGDFYNQN